MSELQVYIVNVWCSSGAVPEFRATARAVENLEPRFFTSVDELGRYLAKSAAEAGPARLEGRPSNSGDPLPNQQRNSP
jgi:hypothetical protein